MEAAMPHLTIECSGNLADQVGMRQLCDLMHRTLLESGLFELGAVRVRAYPAGSYTIADQLPENAFADLRLRIGQGRSEIERQALGRQLMTAAEGFFADRLAGPHFALTLSIEEIDGRFSWKKNSIHPRLRERDKH
jgi:5-carboxymethyl-2-hydroxymuconate isomerase